LSSALERICNVANDLQLERVSAFDGLMRINRQVVPRKRVYTREFEPAAGKITLIPFGDLHIGHSNAVTHLVTMLMDYITESEDCYAILLGDVIENATRTSVGLGMFSEDIHLRDQINAAVEILSPIAEADRLLGIHTGNHEFRSAILTGLNPAELIATQLGVPYLGYQAFYTLKVGAHNYRVMSTHGVGSGRTSGAKANAAERPADIAPLMDIYLSGHTHIKHAHELLRFYVNDNNELVPLPQYYVTCGSFMSYFGEYAEMQVLKPHSTGVPKIELGASDRNISVIL